MSRRKTSVFVVSCGLWCACCLVLAPEASAVVISWNGSVSTDWADADNWDGPAAPADDATSDVGRFDLSSYTNQPDAAVARSVAGLQIGSNSGPLTISLAPGSTIGGDGIVMESGAASTSITTGGNNMLFFGSGNLTVLNSSSNPLSFTARLNGSTLTIGGAGLNATTGQVNVGNNSRSYSNLVVNSGTFQGNRGGGGADVLVGNGTIFLGDETLGNANDATIINNGTNFSSAQPRPMVVRAGSSGTLTYRSITNATNSGGITLNNNLVVGASSGNTLTLSGVISGSGDLIRDGADGTVVLSAANTYTGNTHVNAGTLQLSSGGSLLFVLQEGGLSNRILGGGGTLNLAGTLQIDATALNDQPGLWNLVEVDNLIAFFDPGSFGLEFVGGSTFVNAGGGLYTNGDWSFNTATGNLQLSGPIPEPSTLGLLLLGSLFMLGRRRSPHSPA